MNPITFAGCKEIVSFRKNGKKIELSEEEKESVQQAIVQWDGDFAEHKNFRIVGDIVESRLTPGKMLFLDGKEAGKYRVLSFAVYLAGPNMLNSYWNKLDKEALNRAKRRHQKAEKKLDQFLKKTETRYLGFMRFLTKDSGRQVEVEYRDNPRPLDGEESEELKKQFPDPELNSLIFDNIKEMTPPSDGSMLAAIRAIFQVDRSEERKSVI